MAEASLPERSLIRAALPNALLRLAGQGGEFVAFLLFARRLGPAAFGSLASAFLVCRYLGLVADLGAAVFGARLVATGDHDEAAGLLQRRTLLTCVLVPCVVVGLLLMRGAGYVPLAITVAARGWSRDWIALGRHAPVRAASPACVQGIVCAVGAAITMTEAASVSVLGFAYASGTVLSLLLNRRGLQGRARGGRPHRRADEYWPLLFSIGDQVFASADVLLLNVLVGRGAAGTYAALYRLPNALITVFGLLIAGAVPAATRALQTGRSRELLRSGRRIGVVATLAISLAALPAGLAVRPLFGPAFVPGRTALVVLTFSVAAVALSWGVQPLYLASGSIRDLALWTAAVAFLNLMLNMVLIARFGLAGAAISTLVGQCLASAFYLLRTRVLPAGGADGPESARAS